MKRLLIGLAIAAALPAGAQTITFKNGKKTPGAGLKRSGDTILSAISVAGGSGTVGYPISNIARIDFPKPAALEKATKLLSEGKAKAALTEVESVISAQSPFRSIPGNWWARAAAVKLIALVSLRQDQAAGQLLAEVRKGDLEPATRQLADLSNAMLLSRKGDYEQSIDLLAPILKDSRDPGTLAAAWVCEGDNRLGLKEPSSALRAYLHLPVFYPEQALWMPGALLGSARAFEAIDDLERANGSLDTLLKDYGSSPEAGLAVLDRKRIEHKLDTQKSSTN